LIWNLLLAHFMGDFLLQSDWVANRKTNFWVLVLHVGTVFGLMLLLVGNSRWAAWPYLLFIAAIHLLQDRLKIALTNWKQAARVPFFLLDQLIHYVVIVGVVTWFNASHPALSSFSKPAWIIYALALLLVTDVWFITERVIFADNPGYVTSLNQTKYVRMLSRAGLAGLFFLFGLWLSPGVALILPMPYPRSEYQKRAFLTDVCVSISGVIFLLLALN
jgi:hypothetical protein